MVAEVEKTASALGASGYLRTAGAADYLNLSIRKFKDLVAERKVPVIRLSPRLHLFRPADLDRAMDRFRTKAVGE